jgi:acetylornithine deacetylase
MKGFVALALNLLRRKAIAGELTEPLMLLLSCNEEIGTVGAGQFVEQWGDRAIPRRCLVGEPTSLQAIRGHKGHTGYTIRVLGVGSHSGFPQEGINAIERATPVLAALAALREELQEERSEWSDLFPEVPFPVLSIAQVNGGTAINVTPEACTIRVGVRPLPGQPPEAFTERLRAALPDDAHLEMTNGTPSFGAPLEDPFLQEVKGLGKASADIGANFGTDAGRLVQLGCTPVVFGPGDIAVAHKPNEWMPRDEFERTPALLEQLITR